MAASVTCAAPMKVSSARRCASQVVPAVHSSSSARLLAGCSRRPGLACFARAGGPGVLDKPTTTTTTPDKTTHKSTKRPPTYKVMLHNDNYNRREYVVKVLLKIVSQITVDDAVVVMQEAHESGVAMVIACPQDEAEQYCEGLRTNGLTSSIEPGR